MTCKDTEGIARNQREINKKKEKTTCKECCYKFLATKEHFDAKSTAQRNKFLKSEFSFLLDFCTISPIKTKDFHLSISRTSLHKDEEINPIINSTYIIRQAFILCSAYDSKKMLVVTTYQQISDCDNILSIIGTESNLYFSY